MSERADSRATVRFDDAPSFEARVPFVVVGAGACGVVAALAARERGIETLVVERDASPRGSTSMSSGFVPAPGTRVQRAADIDDTPERFAGDIQAKAGGHADPVLVDAYTRAIGPALDWLGERHGVPFELLEGFLYPGHGAARMHAVPERTGEALLERLWRAAREAGVELLAQARAVELVVARTQHGAAERLEVRGIVAERPDGARESIGCDALLLACNGYGGDRELVARWLPEFAGAPYHGHAGNRGDAVRWAQALGVRLADLGAAQGHGSLAHPHAVLVTWALMMEGGIQVNRAGERFANEHAGYSEAALAVLAQPGATAFDVYDERLHALGMTFPDYRAAFEAGAVRRGDDAASLAAAIGVPAEALARTLDEIARLAERGEADPYGRRFDAAHRLVPPYRAIAVTGALFHTQGGLVVDATMRALREDGTTIANLHAAGGAARGVSGDRIAGYLSGNGLLSAIAGGWIAGRAVDVPPAVDLSDAVALAEAHESPWSRDPSHASWGIHRADPAPWNVLRGPVFPRGPASGVVLQRGRELARWGEPARADLTFSVAKTYLALLAGVAHDRGLMPDPDEPVGARVRGIGFDDGRNARVTWSQLLQQTSEWEGSCFGIPDQVDRYRTVAYVTEPRESGRKGDARPLREPGTYWEYNDVRINQLSLALLHLFRRPLPEVWADAVMRPIGASDDWHWDPYDDAYVEIDGMRMPSVPGGTHWGGGVRISSLDQARIGQLLLQRGRWGEAQVVSASWIERMTMPCAIAPYYGYLTWLNTGRRLYPSASAGSFFAIGAGSTLNWIDPEHELVAIVRWIDATAFDAFCAAVARALR